MGNAEPVLSAQTENGPAGETHSRAVFLLHPCTHRSEKKVAQRKEQGFVRALAPEDK